MSSLKEDMRKLEKSMSESARRMEEAVAQTTRNVDRYRAESRKQWGDLANKLGTLVEDIVAPSLPDLLRERFGAKELESSAQRVRRVHRIDRGRRREFDFVAMSGRLLFVNETKSTLRPEYIADFVAALEDVRNYLPEAEGHEVIGCLAAFSFDRSLIVAGERQGLLMLGLNTGLLRVLNTPGFVPRRF